VLCPFCVLGLDSSLPCAVLGEFIQSHTVCVTHTVSGGKQVLQYLSVLLQVKAINRYTGIWAVTSWIIFEACIRAHVGSKQHREETKVNH
jgi:hypothetical protein